MRRLKYFFQRLTACFVIFLLSEEYNTFAPPPYLRQKAAEGAKLCQTLKSRCIGRVLIGLSRFITSDVNNDWTRNDKDKDKDKD